MQGLGDRSAVYSLNSSILGKHRPSTLVSSDLLISEYVAQQLGDVAEQRNISVRYFQVAHHWLPMISKQNFYRVLDASPAVLPADLTLLLLCMKLIDWLPDTSCAQTAPYRAAKHFFLELELAGTMSPTILQAALLIALYELGHAIYPVACISVGICVRYGAALGTKPRLMASTKETSAAWVEEEERTRLWWALLLLDRSVFPILSLVLFSLQH